MRNLTIHIFCIIFSANIYGQHEKIGLLPQLYINLPLLTDYRLNIKLESRQIFDQNTNNISLFNERSDISSYVIKRIGFNTNFAFGYMFRMQDREIIQRLSQNASILAIKDAYKVGHRFAMDQTYSSIEPDRYRFRYRLSVERPLRGRTLDANELFLRIGNEYLYIWEENTDIEIRALASLGYQLPNKTKVELGIDYRIDQILASDIKEQLYLSIAVFFKK